MEKEKQRSVWAREYQCSFALFVDFLPSNMNNLWLRRLFNNHGKVTDAFVPKKLRKETTNRFGFVRYSTREEAQRAIHIGNGAWLGGKKLVVKWTRFPRMEKHHSVEATNRAPYLKEVQRGSRLHSPTVRGDSQLHGKAFQHKSTPYSSEGVKPNQQYSLLSLEEKRRSC